MQVYDKEMDLNIRKALVELELQDVQILLLLNVSNSGPSAHKRKILMMNNDKSGFGDVFLFPVFGGELGGVM